LLDLTREYDYTQRGNTPPLGHGLAVGFQVGNWKPNLEMPETLRGSAMSNDPARDNSSLKWVVGVLVSVLAAGSGIVALLNYIHPSSSTSVRPLTGTWSYTMKSNVSGRTYQGFFRLTQDGTSVSGEMDDPGKPGITSGVAGTYLHTRLRLSRNTGMNTAQEYELNGAGQQLAGTFKNVGDYADSGTIEIKR
jgi:hypothetical protein